jgi:hypothetical protein
LYQGACICAGASQQAASDQELKADERMKRAEDYANQAVTLLRRAMAGGYRDLKNLRGNPALLPLRGRSDFQELARTLEAKLKAQKP